MSQVLSLIATITSYSVERVATQELQDIDTLSVILWHGASDEVMTWLPVSKYLR